MLIKRCYSERQMYIPEALLQNFLLPVLSL